MSAVATPVDLGTVRAQLLLVLADDELITGHRASHWTGVAPSMEEDMAFSTIAQDEINHADLWYQVLVGLDVTGEAQRTAVDALGLGREPDGYRHAIVCERPPRDFAATLARHWAYERFDAVRLNALTESRDPDIAAVAGKLRFEERYHLEHADQWFTRLTTGSEDARARFRAALAAELPEALGLAEPFPAEEEALAAGLLPVGHQVLGERWLEIIGPLLEAAGFGDLVPTAVPAEARGGRQGRHTADFTEDVWPEMTALYRAHPGARW
ncbi:1,2-phenylacetyl-CoA epoxidase subunit PaaC [Nitriliruptor alkaliphilus]|uniref:1,2-phenylacetyl-CoA epoxidase subunit PaaC n=1 Tax=Nitriliruptor alkaliphilus TaxID=427918 RepID=UPI000695DA19|nr:1,2-phenylacetyl-CoA epoxidase subunit PaaC [Nitriliruptor alkaliphilus]